MGREIRKVIPNWEHPKVKKYNFLKRCEEENYQPLRDEAFAPAMEEWYADWKSWENKTHKNYTNEYPFWEYSGNPPSPEYYRPDWKPEEMTWLQMYETVSEGTPVTPPFATAAELVDYLCKHGTFWDKTPWKRPNAEAFVASGWAPSGMMVGGKMYTAENMAEAP